jgi:NADH-quinone oxidoreductase subunit J
LVNAFVLETNSKKELKVQVLFSILLLHYYKELLIMFNILSYLPVFFAFFASISTNPIHAIIYLILCFCAVGILLFTFNFDFFGLIFIMVYVGAIAVLFLFIIMMLNIKKNEEDFLTKIISGVIVTICIEHMLEIFSGNSDSILYSTEVFYYFKDFGNNNFSIDYFDNLSVFGQYFYNFYNFFFLFIGIILLIALIGAVVLTVHINEKSLKVSKEIDLKQLARSRGIKIIIKS